MPEASNAKVSAVSLVLALLILLLCSSGSAPVSCNFEPSAQFKATCRIRVGGGQGSGTLIAVSDDEALVLSCRHVGQSVNAIAQLEWPSAVDQKTTGRVLANVAGTTYNNDLSLFICDRPNGIEPVRMAKFDPNNGPWTAVGFKSDQCYEAIGDVASEKDGLVTVNCPWTQGMSGCGLFDKYGCIVAVIVASDMKSFGLCSDGIALHELVRKYAD